MSESSLEDKRQTGRRSIQWDERLGRLPNPKFPFLNRHFHRFGLTDLLKTGEVPKVGEILALLWFDWVNLTAITFQEDTSTTGLIRQGQAAAAVVDSSIPIDEFGLAQS